jgi:hypothetical protein
VDGAALASLAVGQVGATGTNLQFTAMKGYRTPVYGSECVAHASRH